MERSKVPRPRAARRALSGCLAATLLMAGCSTQQTVHLDQLVGEGLGRATVTTTGGFQYDFNRVQVQGDSLFGTYVVVEERIYEDGGIAYLDVDRQTVLPLSRVASVEVRKIDYGNSALLGAGAALLAIWARSLAEPDKNKPTKTHYGPGTKGGGGPILP